MKQETITIVPQTVNGKTYNNVSLKTKQDKMKKIWNGIDIGNYIVVKKLFAKGRLQEAYNSYSIVADFNGTDISFFLTAIEHEEYVKCGNVGDEIKIVMNGKPYDSFEKTDEKTGKKVTIPGGIKLFVTFEKA